MSSQSGARVQVTGTVQGVGFRPFVYGLATRLGLAGWIRNTSAGVEIEVTGESARLDEFLVNLTAEAPPLAVIQEIRTRPLHPNGAVRFEIHESANIPGVCLPIPADVAVCDECLCEMRDPGDRRYRYPFINCTNCGPRYSIISDLPYDRPYTSMRRFPMCQACAREYQDPLDRRFHAQPVACPQCGPQLWLEEAGVRLEEKEGALKAARRRLSEGQILAIQGLGGFHLACDATNPKAVGELRARKHRRDKPLALMMPDLSTVRDYCRLTEEEAACLVSRQRPILLLERREIIETVSISPEVSPSGNTLGVMLPYTPLHHLLLEPDGGFPSALVMTSGNRSEEPILTDAFVARDELAGIADAFLLHDREILNRCDDSVARHMRGKARLVRRARGYAPAPVRLTMETPPILAVGAELKNTFCLTRGAQAFLSPHIGDLDNQETLAVFERSIAEFERLYRTSPEFLACDSHPDYLSSRYAHRRAQEGGMELFQIQHHHAHIAACMADNCLDGENPLIGVALDGTGLGPDGAVWGGEILLATYHAYKRLYHLRYVPLCGGDLAARQVWRTGYAWLREVGLHECPDLPPIKASGIEMRHFVEKMISTGLNCPLTSSMGRLFDAAASILGIRQEANYEAQAAIELEALADPSETFAYPCSVNAGILDPAPMVQALAGDFLAGIDPSILSARFHNTIVQLVVEACRQARLEYHVHRVALSGGVWQNRFLFERAVARLEAEAFEVSTHERVPANDGGLALGQAAIVQALTGGSPDSLSGKSPIVNKHLVGNLANS